jgi:lathosterol oxidase
MGALSPSAAAPEFRLGEGKLSGALSVALGALGLGAVLCMLYPSWLTTPELRALYPLAAVRGLIQAVLIAGFGLGLLSIALRSRRATGWVGIAFCVAATLCGGSQAELGAAAPQTHYLGLDWFLLNLFFLALVFIPLERVLARDPDQRVLRGGWKTDLAHFFASHIGVQVTVLLTFAPAILLFEGNIPGALHARVQAQPLALQFLEALLLADLFAYFAHRLFHGVPLLWRFHAIHHSSQQMDWLASSRLHLVDIVITRALGFVPLYVMGFSPSALYAYLMFASLQAIFIHTNVGLHFGPLRYVIATPQYHHWHHGADPEAIDVNFAVHLPLIDRVFGTYYLPGDRWPRRYGIEGNPVPEGYLRQSLYPFR